ncbi:MAG: hypothetical protein HY716_03780 [Planctomycetes bacterium]|nr:hypothetical protein [Planctomycetota bacterium]
MRNLLRRVLWPWAGAFVLMFAVACEEPAAPPAEKPTPSEKPAPPTSEVGYKCSECGVTETAAEGAAVPNCCGKPMVRQP